MCTEPGGQTVAYLRLMWDVPSVQDHCQNRGWLDIDSHGVTHAYRARDRRWLASSSFGTSRLSKTTAWAEGGLPFTHMG